MGNCINLPLNQSSHKLRGLKRATESAKTINSATEHSDDLLLHDFTLPTKTGLQAGEIQNAVPCIKELQNLLVSPKKTNPDGVGARKLKIVVTKGQLKLLLGNAKKLQSRPRLVNYTCRKWRPSLSAILEVQDF